MKARKLSSVLLGASLCLSIFLQSSNAETISTSRVSGVDRYSTSIKVSSEFDKSDFLILASGENYPDALFGSTLATQENAPLVLTSKNSVSKDILNEITRLGVKEVFVLGGTNTLSTNIVTELEMLGVKVTRIAGENRVETANLISEKRKELKSSKLAGDLNIISAGVDGYNFPDALVAGPFVAEYGNGTNNIAVLIPDTTSTFDWQFGGNRMSYKNNFSGSDRYETAASVAKSYKDVLGKSPDTIILASGESFPDALSASSLSSKYGAPILLTQSKNTVNPTLNYIKENKIKRIIAVGGENSISNEVLNAYRDGISYKAPVSENKKHDTKEVKNPTITVPMKPEDDHEFKKKHDTKEVKNPTITVPMKPEDDHEYMKNTFVEARVTKVFDGDTIEVLIAGSHHKVRMVGVDTPETVHPNKPVQFFGKEASDFTKKMLTGKTVYLQKDVSERDNYGRLLRYVWLKRPSKNEPSKQEVIDMMYNATLVKNGYAHAYSYPPDVKYIPIFRELENKARTNNIGLWNKNAESKFKPSTHAPTTKPAPKPIPNNNHGYVADTSRVVVKGNKRSGIYHMPGDQSYNKISRRNVVYFNSAQEAENAGYRRARR